MGTKKEIRWVDFRANYVDPEDEEELELDDDDFEDEPRAVPMEQFIEAFQGGIVNTPWGPFGVKNKFAPFNFYDLAFAHFKGFTTFSIPDFVKIMDAVEGVAVWKQMDPYCVIVGKAKLYEWPEVKMAISKALLNDNSVELLTQSIIQECSDKGLTEYVTAIFPNNQVITILPEDVDRDAKIAQIEQLKQTMKGLIVIENGVVVCK